MLSSHDVARYFLSLVNEEVGDSISNLKLQKLVYYAQGFYLALYGKPLFKESIEAWTHGPVIPELYQTYKSSWLSSYPIPNDIDFSIYNSSVKELLNEIYMVYGQYSAWKLRDLTHDEPVWKNAFLNIDKTISHQDMTSYFKTFFV